MQINNKQLPNFFKQPALGFDAHSQGRSDAQLAEYEAKVGFKLPPSYRELLRLQNGGSVRYEKIAGEESFSFYGGFSQLRPDLDYYITNFKNYILLTCDEGALADTQKKIGIILPRAFGVIFGFRWPQRALF